MRETVLRRGNPLTLIIIILYPFFHDIGSENAVVYRKTYANEIFFCRPSSRLRNAISLLSNCLPAHSVIWNTLLYRRMLRINSFDFGRLQERRQYNGSTGGRIFSSSFTFPSDLSFIFPIKSRAKLTNNWHRTCWNHRIILVFNEWVVIYSRINLI